mmetsp:Transcript_25551/g.51116  ORF Transcript_25551/g.51116 Transcript_25551/m.51116 type:complete len:225 (+) Transcript_25551:151-825(+)
MICNASSAFATLRVRLLPVPQRNSTESRGRISRSAPCILSVIHRLSPIEPPAMSFRLRLSLRLRLIPEVLVRVRAALLLPPQPPVQHPEVPFQGGNARQFFRPQPHARRLEVLADARGVGGLGDDGSGPVQVPCDENLRGRGVGLRGHVDNGLVLEQDRILLPPHEGWAIQRAERRVGCDEDAAFLACLEQRVLLQVRLQLHLVHFRNNLGVFADLLDLLDAEV